MPVRGQRSRQSIQCIRRPPSSAPNGLVSFGKTSSIISDFDSLIGLGRKFPSFVHMFPGTDFRVGLISLTIEPAVPTAPAHSIRPCAARTRHRASSARSRYFFVEEFAVSAGRYASSQDKAYVQHAIALLSQGKAYGVGVAIHR